MKASKFDECKMQGYQFAHVETWSLAGGTGSDYQPSEKRRNGQKKWAVAEILDEAARVPGSCEHVDPWCPGPQVLPGACAGFEELRAAHSEAVQIRERFDYTDPKTREKTVRQRKLRKDARTLYTAVFSLPVESKDALSDPHLRADCEALLSDAIEHEADRIEGLGGVHAMSVIHWDERMVHAHFYGLDPARGRVSHLHPGTAAKEAFAGDPSRQLRLSKKQLNMGGNRAYRRAMRVWQNELHEEVFAPAGLLRFGPRRQRMSRNDYLEARQAASERAADIERQRDLDLRAAEIAEFGQRLLESHEADMALRVEWSDDLDQRSRDLDAYQDALTEDRNVLLADAATNARREKEIEVREGIISSREATLRERERAADARDARLSDRERDAARREAEASMREADADATLAAFEAVTGGIVEIEGDDKGGLSLRPSSDPDRARQWPEIEARMAARPVAAKSVVRRVHQRLEAMRERARHEAESRFEAALGAVAAARQMVLDIFARLRPLETKLSPTEQQDLARAEADAGRLAVSLTVAKRKAEAAKRGDER